MPKCTYILGRKISQPFVDARKFSYLLRREFEDSRILGKILRFKVNELKRYQTRKVHVTGLCYYRLSTPF